MKFLPGFGVVYCECVNECICGYVRQSDDLQITCVFQQHFQSDQAQDQAAGPGRVIPEAFSQLEPDGAAQKRNDKSDHAMSSELVQMFTSNTAKLTPTARASMLVATASRNMRFTP